jgi:hypothetical protein
MKQGTQRSRKKAAPVVSDQRDWFRVSDVERKSIAAFVKKHHGPALDFTLRFTATGIGTKIVVKCQGCGKEADVSDYESW